MYAESLIPPRAFRGQKCVTITVTSGADGKLCLCSCFHILWWIKFHPSGKLKRDCYFYNLSTTKEKHICSNVPGIRKNTWQHYDYNNGESNYVAYGQPTSPIYNPALIPATLPVLVIAGDKDWTAPRQGINVFLTQLQNSATLVNLSNYAHYDLTYSATRENDVYMPILQFLEGPTFAWPVTYQSGS